ncbi:MAG: DUF2079 domain-containing protein [Actinobacteria bacterium]|nr:DUF2079 domain-containing protein [Actinomycetota bacterium]
MKKENIILIYILAIFGIVFSLISLVNQYEFRTYALDLGMFNQALYDFAHLKLNYFSLYPNGTSLNYFADHFSLITVLYAPFYYLLRTYTLLVIQILAILFGGAGIYQFARHETKSRYLPLIVIIQFFGIWGIYSALAFDFHNNVVAAMFVPWLAFCYVTGRRKLFVLFFVLILISKENMALWLVFIMLGLMLGRGLSRWRRFFRFEIPLLLFAAVYFVFVIGLFMPALGNDGGSAVLANRYAPFGNSAPAIAVGIVSHPGQTLTDLFESSPPTAQHADDKEGLHVMVLTSGGLALLAAPSYIVMLIPIYLQKMLSVDPALWGVTGQYSIEFVPIISLAFTALLVKLKRRKLVARWQYPAAVIIMVMTYGSLSYAIANGKLSMWKNDDNVNLFSSSHWRSSVDVSAVNSYLAAVPPDAAISVSSSLAPHLSFRDKIYQYPVIKDAQYLVLMQDKRDNFVDPRSLPQGWRFQVVAHNSFVDPIDGQIHQFWIYKRSP